MAILSPPKLLISSSLLQFHHFHYPIPFNFQQKNPNGINKHFHLERHQRLLPLSRALRKWQDYEEAVKRKDLAEALRFLESFDRESAIEPINDSAPAGSAPSALGNPRLSGWERDWEVLDTCLNADDMKLVADAYGFLRDRGFLPNFGKCRNIVLEGRRDVTPSVLESTTGLEVSKLSPKKWGLSGSSRYTLIAFLGGTSFLLSQDIDIRPNLLALLGLAFLDSILLGGTCLAQISSYWPPYRRRILVHEAGHLLTAYLMGCPIRGVILDPIVAMQMGIQGQAGTQFWDEKMASSLAEGRLDGTSFDRYCMVLFAGIAAEALVYGEAEGGENDENLFRSICILLQPPLSVAQMSNQARWAVLQSYNLLKWHKHAHQMKKGNTILHIPFLFFTSLQDVEDSNLIHL
ncbi:unnamed protein product [Citrullus colocynthis]|uniref:ATP-dependent zinc metalloprotease n=1 Tax=Citrullus colocynthis TaxID=252529 RepID=A0ABP0XM66_9ROSI